MEPLNVLVVVETNPFEDVCESLSSVGHRTTSATSVPDAEAALEAHAPDVLVCDWDLTGARTIRLLQLARNRHPKMGRVLLTTAPGEDWSLMMARNMVHVVLVRPFDPTELRHAVGIARAFLAGPTPQDG